MTIKTFTNYPEKGPYSDDKRRTLNATIHAYVMEVVRIYPAYATTAWYKEKYLPLVENGDFGNDFSQSVQAQLCILGLSARGSMKAFYEEIVEFVPYLGEYLTILARSWEFKEPTKVSMELRDYALVVNLPPTTPTATITTALEEHGEQLESTLKGLDGATGVARGGRRNLQKEFLDGDNDDDDDDDEEIDKVWDFNKPMTQGEIDKVWDFNKPTTQVENEDSVDESTTQKKRAATSLRKGQQLTMTQLTDTNSVAREMLKSKHLEKIIAKAVSSTAAATAAVTSTTVEQSVYTKLQGKVTEQQAINKALQDSLGDQERELKLQQKHAIALEKKINTIIQTTSSTPPTPVPKRSPNSLDDLANRTLAEDFLILNPNKYSNKFFNYFHDGEGFTMQPQNYADSRLPKMKIKYYVDTIGLMKTFALHAVQFGIHVHQIEDIEAWDDRNANPPTCPYTHDLTHQCDKVYTIAASKLYTKLSQTIELKHPVLKQSFIEAGQHADGYVALYYLQSYGNPKFIDRSVEMPKPSLGQSRDISFFCRNLHNYSMYKTLLGDRPTKLNLYEFAISQINTSFPGEYTKGIKEVEDKINVWRALSTNPAIGATQPFPQDAEIEGSKLAFAIMRKYTEAEARVLFKEDTYQNDEDEEATIDKAEVKATQPSRYNRQSDSGRSKYRGESSREGGGPPGRRYRGDDKKKNFQRRTPTKQGFTPWKYREGVYCSICGSEGHEAIEDGCFATGRFIRMIKNLDQTIYKRIKQKYGDLLKTIDNKLQDSIDHRSSRRKERNAKITYMELADTAWNVAETEDEARQICINCAYTVFPDIATDSSEEEFEDAESS